MPTSPPVPPGQRYPLAIRDFLTYRDQPQDGTKIFTNPDGSVTDLTLDKATVTRDLQTEIVSLETTIGTNPNPISMPAVRTMGAEIAALWSGKATGRVDVRGSIIGPGGITGGSLPPNPSDAPLPPSHSHEHRTSRDLNSDDHPQYMRVDSARPFSAPVTAPAAVAGTNLINLSQAKGAGLNSSQVSSIIASQLAALKLVPGEAEITGPDSRRWKMAGGVSKGYTDINGNLWVDLTPCGFAGIRSFIYMKMPYSGQSMLGWYAFQYMEDQLVLMGLSTRGALIQFIEDIRVDRQAYVSMCWMALGV